MITPDVADAVSREPVLEEIRDVLLRIEDRLNRTE